MCGFCCGLGVCNVCLLAGRIYPLESSEVTGEKINAQLMIHEADPFPPES